MPSCQERSGTTSPLPEAIEYDGGMNKHLLDMRVARTEDLQ